MQFANATNLNRKSGVAQWRDLRFHSIPINTLRVGRLPPIGREPSTFASSGIHCFPIRLVRRAFSQTRKRN